MTKFTVPSCPVDRDCRGHVWKAYDEKDFWHWQANTCSVSFYQSKDHPTSFSLHYKRNGVVLKGFEDAAGLAAEFHARDLQDAKDFIQRYT